MAEPKVIKSIVFPAKIASRLEEYADSAGISQTQIVILAVRAYLDRLEGKKNPLPHR